MQRVLLALVNAENEPFGYKGESFYIVLGKSLRTFWYYYLITFSD